MANHGWWFAVDGRNTQSDDTLRSDSILDGNTAWLAAPHPDGTVTTYRTVDGGETWTSSRLIAPEVTHGDPSLPIQIEIVDAQHGWLDVYGGSMWAGVSALFQTTDGGQTWTRLSSGIGEISGLLGFQSATTGWAGGARAGGALAAPSQPDSVHPGPLFVTRNGGQTWQYQPLPLPADEDASSIVEAVGPPQFSSDHDGSFAALLAPTARRNSVAIEVYQTHDAGHTWTTTPTFSLGLTSTGEAADFVGGRYGWVLDGSKLATTDDGGQHWTTVTPTGLLPDPSGFLVEQLDFVDARTGWALVIAPHDPSTTIVLKTDDGGHTWKVVAQSSTPSFTTTVHEYHAVAFADAGHGCVAASDGVFCTADGGRTWRMGDAGTTSIVQMQFSSATLGWAVAVDRQPAISTPSVVATGTVSSDLLLRTRDGGLHWQPIAHLAALRSISFADDQNGWAVTDQGLRVSHDGGESWTAVRLPIGFGVEPRAQGFGPPLLPANLASRQVGWLVGDGGRVVGTSDGGTSWTTGWTPPFGASWTNGPVDIRFTGARIGWLLLALGQGCASQEPYALYRTDDGVQWTLSLVGEGACGIFNEPNYPTTGPFDNIGGYPEDLAALGPNRAWLAIFSPASARLAILSTRDAGKTWAQVGSIPGSFNLVGMQFVSDTEGWLITRRPPAYPRDDNRLLHTTDGGATWQRVWP